jgi:hypothetical protein
MFTKLVLGRGIKQFASFRKVFFNTSVFRLSILYSREESNKTINEYPSVKIAKEEREMLLTTLPFLDKDVSEWKDDGNLLQVIVMHRKIEL